MLDRIVNHQAQIIAYINDYVLMIITTMPAILLLLLMRRPRYAAATPEPAQPTE
jgi:DHA2 family multidrug resistance protein